MSTVADDVDAGRDRHRNAHVEDCREAVAIHVNNKPVYIHPGNYQVATIKKLAGVPLADDLDQLVDSTLEPIPDDANLDLRGCEIFISHVKDGGSS